ncbi:MAG: GNAT family N-acetyltransferase [Candidatus Heimdallarchaeaceae archaeon]
MISLETERLFVRNFSINDWEDLAELAMKYEETELAKFDEGPWPSNLQKYKEIVENFAKTDDFLAVILKENKKLIGLIYKAQKEEKKFEFGFNFNSDFQGRGYATESCKAVLDYIVDLLKAEEVTAGTAKINEPSNKLKRLGFEFVREKKIAFRKDEEGNPIEFVGVDYILQR